MKLYNRKELKIISVPGSEMNNVNSFGSISGCFTDLCGLQSSVEEEPGDGFRVSCHLGLCLDYKSLAT